MDIQLNKLIEIDKFEYHFARNFLKNHFFEFYLPTEVVVNTPQICVPNIARVYVTKLYQIDNTIMDYNELRKRPDFKGTAGTPNIKNIYLWEAWEDLGNDGHMYYQHTGYFFLTDDSIDPIKKEKTAYPRFELDNVDNKINII